MTDALTLGAALMLGLAASGHCLVMCGGISAALGIATAKGRGGRPRPGLLLGYQLGRILSYALAGLAAGGVMAAALALLDIDAVRRTLRALSAAALLLAALVAFGMVWGWMPCGFVYTVLMIAAAQGDARRGAATMAAFGFGTMPSMLLAAFGAGRLALWGTRPLTRRIAGVTLLASAALTLLGPWLPHSTWLQANLPFVCRTP